MRDYPLIARGRDVAEAYVIYGLVDPREPDRVRYVGKSVNPISRFRGHILNGSGAVAEWICCLRAAGCWPDMVLLEEVGPKAMGRELYWYASLKNVGQADLNGFAPNDHQDFKCPPRRTSEERRGRPRTFSHSVSGSAGGGQ